MNFMGLLIVVFALSVTFLLSKVEKNKHIRIYVLYIINIFYIYMYRILFVDDKADLGPFLGSWMASRQNVVFWL